MVGLRGGGFAAGAAAVAASAIADNLAAPFGTLPDDSSASRLYRPAAPGSRLEGPTQPRKLGGGDGPDSAAHRVEMRVSAQRP